MPAFIPRSRRQEPPAAVATPDPENLRRVAMAIDPDNIAGARSGAALPLELRGLSLCLAQAIDGMAEAADATKADALLAAALHVQGRFGGQIVIVEAETGALALNRIDGALCAVGPNGGPGDHAGVHEGYLIERSVLMARPGVCAAHDALARDLSRRLHD